MMNKNKIHSLVNSGNFNALKVAKGTGIIYSSFQSKLKSGSWSPDDVEKLAEFFKKPISYFFDKKETTVNEPAEKNKRPGAASGTARTQ